MPGTVIGKTLNPLPDEDMVKRSVVLALPQKLWVRADVRANEKHKSLEEYLSIVLRDRLEQDRRLKTSIPFNMPAEGETEE